MFCLLHISEAIYRIIDSYMAHNNRNVHYLLVKDLDERSWLISWINFNIDYRFYLTKLMRLDQRDCNEQSCWKKPVLIFIQIGKSPLIYHLNVNWPIDATACFPCSRFASSCYSNLYIFLQFVDKYRATDCEQKCFYANYFGKQNRHVSTCESFPNWWFTHQLCYTLTFRIYPRFLSI